MKIDVHHHFLPKAFFEDSDALLPPHMEAVWNDGRVVYRERATGHAVTPPLDVTLWHDSDLQLRHMDAASIDHAVVSSACYQDWMTLDAARIINDGTAALVRTRPDRFSGMISVPPDGGDAMIAEIERARNLGLCAVNITTTHQGRYPDHEDFRLLFETAARLQLPVYVHPSWRTPLQNMERWDMERAIGKPTDLTIGIANLMFSGRFHDLPELRMMFAHLGGTLPVTMRRMFHGQPGWLRVPDYDYPTLLKRLYVDTAPAMWWTPTEIESAAAILGVGQMLLGSDYPLSNDPAEVLKLAVANIAGTTLREDEKRRIFADNAIDLFCLHHLRDQASLAHPGHRHGTGCC
jgi:aminocarboxymuconate-semialdehyde decarboxylase